MSYTPTLSPFARPRVEKQRQKTTFTHLPTPSPTSVPTRIGLVKENYDFPYGAVLMILCFLYILARINKKKQHTDTEYTGIQMNQIYTLDPVRRRRI
jgi:hypothetical protein